MKPLFDALDVDYAQWHALTRAMLRRDFRGRSFSMGRAGRASDSGGKALLGQFIIYSVIGMFLSIAVVAAKDLFFAGTLLCTYVMFMTGMAVMLDHSTALTSADDYAILGYRPVSSRTYFAVRLTNVLVYTLLLTTLVSYLPITFLFLKRGALAGIAGLGAMFGSSIATAFLLLVSYGAVQRLVGANLLKQVLSILQLVMSFFVYGGYMIVNRSASKAFLAEFTLDKTWLVALTPPAWFGSYFDLARGDFSAITLVPAALTILALAGMTFALTGSLASGFADRLGEVSVTSASPASAKATARQARAKATSASGQASAGGWLFREGANRAMALLIRSQFRNDQKFRMGILTILPLTALYIFQGMSSSGEITDGHGGGFILVGFAIMMFPAMLKMQLTRSDSYRASWIFFAAPVSRARLIRAAKDVVVILFLAPYVLIVAAAMAYATGDPARAITHVLLLGLISHLVLQVTILMDPELPFAKPFDKGGGPSRMMLLMTAIGITNVAMTFAAPWIFASWLPTAAAAAAIIALSVIVELLTKARVEDQARKIEFAG